MPRSLVLSNGYLTVCLDDNGYVRDLSYPHVGLENHVAGLKHRIGVQVDGMFSWLDDPSWTVQTRYEPATMIGTTTWYRADWNITITSRSAIYNELPIFIRHIHVANPDGRYNSFRIFFAHEFAIGETRLRNTAFYDPTKNAVLHYKGRRVFLVNGQTSQGGISDYTVGVFDFGDKEGSWRDAEDGLLSKNAVEHGPVDSVISLECPCQGSSQAEMTYWLCAAETIDDAYKLNEVVLKKSPLSILNSTQAYWKAWISTCSHEFADLQQPIIDVYLTSLHVLRSHIDHDGGILASLDSDMLLFGKDSYAYVWPRDGAYVAMTLDKAGFSHSTRRFFEFTRKALHPDGYLHHKFQPDLSLGSTWHSSIRQNDWLEERILQLPIQEDETAIMLHALWGHFTASKDIEFIEANYKPFIERAADFLVAFRNKTSGLPIHSYDLWEEVTGVSTYTCATVYGGLMAASRFAELLGKANHSATYAAVARDVRAAMQKYLYDPDRQSFVRTAFNQADGSVTRDGVIDASSVFGLWYYDVLPPDDPQLISSIKTMYETLMVPSELNGQSTIGGFIRYENDGYFRDGDQPFPNPWIITTLWETQRKIKYARSLEEVRETQGDLRWVIDRMRGEPVMAEQYHPITGAPRSVSPLNWSHAVFVETVLAYVNKIKVLQGAGESWQPNL